jgi:hypothetical protein
MKVSRKFVKWFLMIFLVVIVGNIITPFFKVWNIYYLLTLCFFLIFLSFLICRKKDNQTINSIKFSILRFPAFVIIFLFKNIFQTLLVTYLVLLLIQQIWTSTIFSNLNLNYLLVLVIISGILDVFLGHKEQEHQEYKKPNWGDYSFTGLLGIVGFFIIKYKTIQLGWLSWVISIIAGMLIILLSLLVLEDDEQKE